MDRAILKFIGLAAFTAVVVSFDSCVAQDDGPSVEDHFLNYDIPQINPSFDIPVGAFYSDVGENGIDDKYYQKLIGEYDLSAEYPQLCPNIRPVLGRYSMNLNTAETVALFQQHIDWANDAGIDFLIMPNINEDQNTYNHLNKRGVDLINYMEGLHTNSYGLMRWGNLRYCVSVEMSNFSDKLSSSNMIEDVDLDANGVSQRMERVYTYFKGLAERFFITDSLYYMVDGKPLVVLLQPHRLHAHDSKQLYQNIRDTVYKYSGKEMFLVARQEHWTPSARYLNTFIVGGVDAVYMDNMFETQDFSLQNLGWPQCIDQNYQYNRQFIKENYGIDFVPSISPSFVRWVSQNNSNEHYGYLPVYHDVDLFTDMCNVAKMNLGDHPMVFIDAFNKWIMDCALEPTDPTYGNGYGMTFLNIVRKQFKVK